MHCSKTNSLCTKAATNITHKKNIFTAVLLFVRPKERVNPFPFCLFKVTFYREITDRLKMQEEMSKHRISQVAVVCTV